MTTTIDLAEINRRNPAMSTGPCTPVGPCRSGFSLTPIRSDRAGVRLKPDLRNGPPLLSPRPSPPNTLSRLPRRGYRR
jgi:hypothetical protein